MRKYYLDNLRLLSIILLFPVHTFMIYNNFGSKFYIWNGDNNLLSTMIVMVNPWFMPLLFVVAGMCARYALKKRTKREFITERINKLLIPFIAGIILLVPIQTLFARKFYYNYEGNIIDNEIYFFTHISDFSGYDGGFTPGQLWFILFLFVISLLSMGIVELIPYEKVCAKVEKFSIGVIIALFIPVWLSYYIGNIGGFSIGKDLSLFLLGYYVLSNDHILAKLDKYKKIIITIYFLFTILLMGLYYEYAYYGDLLVCFVGWIGILGLLVLGKKYLNTENAITKYLNKASYTIYILHQSILVALAYWALATVENIAVQVIIIMLGSLIITIICYEICKRIPVLRFLLGSNSTAHK